MPGGWKNIRQKKVRARGARRAVETSRSSGDENQGESLS